MLTCSSQGLVILAVTTDKTQYFTVHVRVVYSITNTTMWKLRTVDMYWDGGIVKYYSIVKAYYGQLISVLVSNNCYYYPPYGTFKSNGSDF